MGVIVCAARAAGYLVNDDTCYPQRGDPAKLHRGIREHLVEVEEKRPGTLLLFVTKFGVHMGIWTERDTMIHAYYRRGTVEVPFSGPWPRRLVGCFEFAGEPD